MCSNRTVALTKIEQKQFIERALPGRINMIRSDLKKRSYSGMAVVALTSRAVAEFLGIARGKDGKLFKSSSYFEHTTGKSYAVKIKDLPGGQLLDPTKLPADVQKILSDGIFEANVAFAHLTFWPSSVDQTSRASATRKYKKEQYERVQKFGQTVLCLWQDSAKKIKL